MDATVRNANTPGSRIGVFGLGDGHTKFPNILFDLDLDPDEAIVLLALIRYEQISPFGSPADEDFFSLCFGLSSHAVLRILIRIEDRGFIRLSSPLWDSMVMLNFDATGNEVPSNDLLDPSPQDGQDFQDLANRQKSRTIRYLRIAELAAMPYQEYLSTPEWKARREVEIKRAGGRCEFCNTTGPFHVHHRTYERRGNEAPGDLVVLCPPCHTTFHEHRTLA